MLGVLHYLLILCFGIGQITSYEGIEGGCEIDLSPPKFPFVLKSNSTFPYSPITKADTLLFRYSTTVEFHCPGSSVVVAGKDTKSTWIVGTCSRFHPVVNVNSGDISCMGPKKFIVNQHYRPCARNANLHHFYFSLKGEKRLDAFSVCFQNQDGIPLFTSHTLRAIYFSYKEDDIPVDSLKLDVYLYDFNHDPITAQIFNKTQQRIQINRWLNTKRNNEIFVPNDDRYSLVPTLLVPPGDFYYKELKKLTKRFINVVPQWKIINDNNWKKLEREVRKCIRLMRIPLKVWTGIFDIANNPSQGDDARGSHRLYLHGGEQTTVNKFPVPYIFWKLLYSMMTKTAIVLIVINYPFSSNTLPLCANVAQAAGWMLDWEKDNATLGESFACGYSSFRKLVPYLPNIEVQNLLQCSANYGWT